VGFSGVVEVGGFWGGVWCVFGTGFWAAAGVEMRELPLTMVLVFSRFRLRVDPDPAPETEEQRSPTTLQSLAKRA